MNNKDLRFFCNVVRFNCCAHLHIPTLNWCVNWYVCYLHACKEDNDVRDIAYYMKVYIFPVYNDASRYAVLTHQIQNS